MIIIYIILIDLINFCILEEFSFISYDFVEDVYR